MDPLTTLQVDVRAYAKLSVRLAEPGADRDAILAEVGLDEESWEQLDDAWQARLSEATELIGDEESVPPLVKEHADAFAEAQAERASLVPTLSFDRFIEVTLEIQRGQEPQHVLKRTGTTLHDYLRAQQHWLKEMMSDPVKAARFERAVGRAAGGR